MTTWFPVALAVEAVVTAAPRGSRHFVSQDAAVHPPSAVGFSMRTAPSVGAYSPSAAVHTRALPESPARPAGHWNYASVRLKDRSVVVTVNRQEAGTFDQCDSLRGLVQFEVDGSEIEFRRIYWYEAR